MKKRFSHFIFYILIACLFVTCNSNGYNTVSPYGISYSSYYAGAGTNYNQGAIVVYINNSNGYYSNSQYYVVSVYGLGTYNFPPGATQLTIPYVWPGSYSFSVTIGCNSYGNTGCYQEYMNGTAYVNSATTTVVNVYP